MAKPLPPWLQKAKDEGAKEKKSGKEESKAHEKGESKKFEKVEMRGVKGPRGSVTKVTPKMADGGKVAKTSPTATNPKTTSRSDKKMSGNAPGNTLHLKDGGKARC